ncbi:hypothetical protein CYLTODRAFT_391279 [Cylindrobasidium torrendii FP15055 ss-10]|uniref:ubiquitinyl hydrolase 1 n=1 Tax=Cylindrobasidium torrendii FP15055 ss-10 TaxID=1314674 RepID=A0A0D7BL13_9AGAR|nr:hypothetical protein CYLTODRAFT_391279 [Cylindrobasidium torrendii FP15055 ss-10]
MATPRELEYIANHVFMPLKLPQKQDLPDDNGTYANAQALASAVARAAENYTCSHERWPALKKMLGTVKTLHGQDYTSLDLLSALNNANTGDLLALLVREQNAGIILRVGADDVVCETFEVSATNSAVMACGNRLSMAFPGPTTTFPRAEFNKAEFRSQLVAFISAMNRDVLDGSATKTQKAGSSNKEERDTPHPRYITELLATILAAVGGEANTIRPANRVITKRVADDVLWNNTFLPWHRSPLWMVIRVALQTTLPLKEYKSFLLHFMSSVAIDVCRHNSTFESSVLHTLRTKIARRAQKTESLLHNETSPVFETALRACRSLQRILEKRQQATIAADIPIYSTPWSPETLDIRKDSKLFLKSSREYLKSILETVQSTHAQSTFHQPAHHSRLSTLAETIANRSTLDSHIATSGDPYVTLYDFEDLVRNELLSWTQSNLSEQQALHDLEVVYKAYYVRAKTYYAGNAEQQSVMLLVVFELWVAADKLAVWQCPLIRKCHPGLDPALLQPMLLSRRENLARAQAVVDYIQQRCDEASDYPSAFDPVSRSSMSQLYYDSCSEMHNKRATIEAIGRTAREAKRLELERVNAEAERLKREIEGTAHGEDCGYRYSYCAKCYLQKRLTNMRIAIHEWPLPRGELDIKTVIFEMYAPRSFVHWREITYHLLLDLTPGEKQRSDSVDAYLSSYMTSAAGSEYAGSADRITLASTTKSYLNTHYKEARIPASKDEVLKEHGLTWRLFDNTHRILIRPSSLRPTTAQQCTLLLSSGSPYSNLQWVVDSTQHTENDVLSKQHTCPPKLGLSEFVAFGQLRAGGNVQHMNVARALGSQSLTLRAQSVYVLIAQAVQQHGPFPAHQNWHADLVCPEFRMRIANELQRVLEDHRENWQEVATMKAVVLIAKRTIAAGPYDGVAVSILNKTLREVRRVTYGWMRQTLVNLVSTPAEFVDSAKADIREIAGVCCSTFDCEDPLLTEGEDFTTILHSLIVLRDNRSSERDVSTDPVRLLSDLVERVFHRLEGQLRSKIVSRPDTLNQAVTRVWSAFVPGTSWSDMGGNDTRWLMCRTAEVGGRVAQYVQVDLLEGTLLVDGKTIGNLPDSVTSHTSYKTMFGQSVLRAVPASRPGFDYETVDNIEGSQVFFVRQGSDLIMRAYTAGATGPITGYQFIPDSRFGTDLPSPLVDSHVHWLDIDSGSLEVRPAFAPWISTSQNWCLDIQTCVMKRIDYDENEHYLVEPGSATGLMIGERLWPIEQASFVVTSVCNNTVHADLPRFSIAFEVHLSESLTNGSTPTPGLHCLTYPNTMVDIDQSLPTLIGLRSRLVLRETSQDSVNAVRRILVPYGNIDCQEHQGHFKTTIHTSGPSARCAEYHLDTHLGVLTANTSLEQRLWKVLLHAHTSFVLPDPLTGRTGTAEAVDLLMSASCSSFTKLGEREHELLEQIRCLTPKRIFYPEHLEVMQTVTWSCLPLISQITAFDRVASTILEHGKHLGELFYDETRQRLTTRRAPDKLTQRAMHQEQRFPIIDVLNNKDIDVALGNSVYAGRCWDDNIGKNCFAVALAAMTLDHSRLCPAPRTLYGMFESWGAMTLPKRPSAMSIRQSNGPFRYSQSWLDKNDFSKCWNILYDWLRDATNRSHLPFVLLFSLPCLAYEQASVEVARFLIAVAHTSYAGSRQLAEMPRHSQYALTKGMSPLSDTVGSIIQAACLSPSETPSWTISRQFNEGNRSFDNRRQRDYDSSISRLTPRIQQQLTEKWHRNFDPSLRMSLTVASAASYFDVDTILAETKALFEMCRNNNDLHDYTASVEQKIPSLYRASTVFPPTPNVIRSPRPVISNAVGFQQVTIATLASQRPPPMLAVLPEAPPCLISSLYAATPQSVLHHNCHLELEHLITEFVSNFGGLRQDYGDGLRRSLQNLQESTRAANASGDGVELTMEAIQQLVGRFVENCNDLTGQFGNAVKSSFSPRPSSKLDQILFLGGMWPCISARSLLVQMTREAWPAMTMEWQDVLSYLAGGIILSQQASRMNRFGKLQKTQELQREVQNCGPLDVNMLKQNPDWALVQIDGDFRAGSVQLQVAQEMQSPQGQGNITLQLNMGEGKSSVIVPMVASSLANGSSLVRVIVLKPLAPQMYQLLFERISGLANRCVFFLPFNRKMTLGPSQLDQIRILYERCIEVGGVLVAQPEHILSSKLLVVDRAISKSDPSGAMSALRLQRLLHTLSRDILDECDEILHPRYQLIYTMGDQQQLEGGQRRWKAIQDVLSLVAEHAPRLAKEFSFDDRLEVRSGDAGTFPYIISPTRDESTFMKRLEDAVLDSISSGHLTDLNTTRLPEDTLDMVKRFIRSKKEHSRDEECLSKEPFFDVLLVLRGLFAHGLLSYAFSERRWRVDYGLDPSRSLLAVPFRAKDVPSPAAEFGHPDITILLTCLSYYYQGLTEAQVETCLNSLMMHSNPRLLYAQWISKLSSEVILEAGVQDFGGINQRDAAQKARLVFIFARCHAVIEFFLNECVFAKASKEFPHKLPTSGWDLAERKNHYVTGFSGTNDNKYLLPLSIQQVDPVNQTSTNAKVLTFLLRPENSEYACLRNADGKRMDGPSFIDFLAARHPDIRVLLDVGAQMLDMSNYEVAAHWLKSFNPRSGVQAAVFFTNKDEVMVLRRDGATELFKSSPFRHRLHQCVVYLDDAHTRGTDLKMPTDWKAAVTLGKKITKDRLVQGCMRMRQLGKGQSISFFAQPDVDAVIRKASIDAQGQMTDTVSVQGILRWAMQETCNDIEHHAPQWARQGVDFRARKLPLNNLLDLSTEPDEGDIERLREKWLQPEARPLQELYGSTSTDARAELLSISQDQEITARLAKIGVQASVLRNMDEEQEREVAHELEVERQIQRPPPFDPETPSLHHDVLLFAANGHNWSSASLHASPAFVDLFSIVRPVHLAPDNVFRDAGIIATADFMRTVKAVSRYRTGGPDFLKDVRWLLCSKSDVVIISQFEANELAPRLRQSSNGAVSLIVYSPRTSKRMESFDNMKFYSLPSDSPPSPLSLATRTVLNMFSGQLYPSTWDDYRYLCTYLGIATEPGQICDANGFVGEDHRSGEMKSVCEFKESPVEFIRNLFMARHRGQDFSLSPMGRMLKGDHLILEDIEK